MKDSEDYLKNIIPKKPWIMAIFGFLAVIFRIGPILEKLDRVKQKYGMPESERDS